MLTSLLKWGSLSRGYSLGTRDGDHAGQEKLVRVLSVNSELVPAEHGAHYPHHFSNRVIFCHSAKPADRLAL